MVITKDLKNQISQVVSMALDDESFTDFLERFDHTCLPEFPDRTGPRIYIILIAPAYNCVEIFICNRSSRCEVQSVTMRCHC